MTRKFASIELARLYEAQGYLKDALAMYNELDDNVLEGGAEVRAGVKRLELSLLKAGDELSVSAEPLFLEEPPDPVGQILSTLEELNAGASPELPGPETVSTGKEAEIAGLMEKWLALMVVRKRLQLFSRIRARL